MPAVPDLTSFNTYFTFKKIIFTSPVMGQDTFIFGQRFCLLLQKKSWTSGDGPDGLGIPPSPWYCSGGA